VNSNRVASTLGVSVKCGPSDSSTHFHRKPGGTGKPGTRDVFQYSGADSSLLLVVQCGACRAELTISDYLQCNSRCPICHSNFNPRCRNHHFYFAAPHSKPPQTMP
jgi:hypothetical protein